MDISEEYKNMCEKFWELVGKDEMLDHRKDGLFTSDGILLLSEEYIKRRITEIVPFDDDDILKQELRNFLIKNKMNDIDFSEKSWLRFFMHLKYQKYWNSDDWIEGDIIE